jgi:hypothetical protein
MVAGTDRDSTFPKQSIVTVEISCVGLPLRIVSGRVVWVQRPRKIKQVFEISLDFDTPENVWGITPPPEDWLPFLKDQTPPVPGLDTTTVPEVEVSAPAESTGLVTEAMDSNGQTETASYDMRSLELESRDVQLRETIERAVDKSMALISESAVTKIVQQLAGPLASTIAEKVCREITDKLDVRIENTVREAVTREQDRSNQAPRSKAQTKSRRQGLINNSLLPTSD